MQWDVTYFIDGRKIHLVQDNDINPIQYVAEGNSKIEAIEDAIGYITEQCFSNCLYVDRKKDTLLISEPSDKKTFAIYSDFDAEPI